MGGRRLIRRAPSCRTAKMAATDMALTRLMLVRHRRPTTNPPRHPAPTIKVIATSIGVKCPDTTFAQPSRNSQMRIISNNQMMKHGIAAHLAISRSRSPRRIGKHKGNVCTICRATPWLIMPTTYKASRMVSGDNYFYPSATTILTD